jgi:YbgC/YbaW family acyl-CoA thioester hydrolase
MPIPDVDLTVYPDLCDAYGHLNQAAFLSLFERARWEMLARGPGMEVFTGSGIWPAVRRTVIDYHAPAFPADVLRFEQSLIHRGRTSFTMRQTARRLRDDALVATAEFLFVCIDRDGRPTVVPDVFADFMSRGARERSDARRITVNGVTLAVEVQGQGPAVLFIHGYPLDRTVWRFQLEKLEGYRRIAPDLRGMGESDAPDLGYSLATYADDLVALLDTLGVDQAVVCGLSMGGYVAFELMRRFRSRIRGLILIDTRADADSAEARKAREVAAMTARERGAPAIAQEMTGRLWAQASAQRIPSLVAEINSRMGRTPVAGIVGALMAMRDRPDSLPLLHALKGIPTLILVGDEDQITPIDRAAAMAHAVEDAILREVPGAGHLSPLEQPEFTNRSLAEFLQRLP